MNAQIRIAVTSDFSPDNPGHRATNDALQHSAIALGLDVAGDWIPTESTTSETGTARLRSYHGVFSAGGAYASKPGALNAIRFAREQGWPFFGT
jgi:CTP synthase (UTP-ammonia lyase)